MIIRTVIVIIVLIRTAEGPDLEWPASAADSSLQQSLEVALKSSGKAP